MKRLEILVGRVLPTSMDHCLALPGRSKGQSSIYSALERRRLFSLLPGGTQGGNTKVVALSAQIREGELRQTCWGFGHFPRHKACDGSKLELWRGPWHGPGRQLGQRGQVPAGGSSDNSGLFIQWMCSRGGGGGTDMRTQGWHWLWQGGSQSLQWIQWLKDKRKQILGLKP